MNTSVSALRLPPLDGEGCSRTRSRRGVHPHLALLRPVGPSGASSPIMGEVTRCRDQNAHSPLRMTGSVVPSAWTPSMSTWSEPIIQSM